MSDATPSLRDSLVRIGGQTCRNAWVHPSLAIYHTNKLTIDCQSVPDPGSDTGSCYTVLCAGRSLPSVGCVGVSAGLLVLSPLQTLGVLDDPFLRGWVRWW